jgi:beta-glucanase (GH16 family)
MTRFCTSARFRGDCRILLAVLLLGVLCQGQSYQDSFDAGTLNRDWIVSSYTVANYAGGGSTVTFSPSNIDLSQGVLRLELDQPSAGTSTGAEIQLSQAYGYGTYEFTMRVGSTSATKAGAGTPISGQISATFLLSDPNSATEIDAPEIEGLSARSNWVQWTSWKNDSSTSGTPAYTILANPAAAFHKYKITWSASRLDYYIDSVLVSSTKSNIPSVNAHPTINFYGTNSSAWGGPATVGTSRYMYVSSFSYSSIQAPTALTNQVR